MAGTEFSGIQHALVNMFHGAHYILTPNEQSRPEHVELMEREGLTVPETVRLMYELNGEGFSLPLDALSPADCAGKIAESL